MDLNKLNSNLYTKFNRTIDIEEVEGDIRYKLKIRLKPSSTSGIYIDLPKIKNSAKYLQSNYEIAHPPKDCDAIIIDIQDKTVYLIELKRSLRAAKTSEISEQLTAGEKWWNHISFCINNSDNFDIKKLVVMVEERRARSRINSIGPVEGYDFFRKLGNSIVLDI